MKEVVLYQDGTYEINDISDQYATQKLWGYRNHKECAIYHCKDDKVEYYLKRLAKEEIKRAEDKLKIAKKELRTIKKIYGEIGKKED